MNDPMGPPINYTVQASGLQNVPGPQEPVYPYLMQVGSGRVKGKVSDFREGSLMVSGAGIAIDGRAVLPGWQRALWLIPGILIGLLIAAILLEYVVRVRKYVFVRWDYLDDVVFEPERQRVCMVYWVDGNPKLTESLVFTLPGLLEHFEQVMTYFAPGKVRVGKIGPATPIWVYVVVILLLIGIIPLIIVIFLFASAPGR